MRQIIKTFLFLIVIISFAISESIVIQGHTPPGINVEALEKEYLRIRRVFEPQFSKDNSPVIIIYYKKSDTRLLGVRLPEWGGGGALGSDSIIIPIDKSYAFYPDDYFRITLHELVHIALARSYGNIKIPRWFHEGLAMQLSAEVSFDEGVLLSRAIVTNSLLSLDTIEHVNRFNHYTAQVAYSQCHFAMQYMTELYGYDMLPELLDSARSVRRFDTACVKVFGLTVNEFDHIVKAEAIKKYRFVFFYSDVEFLWILVSFFVVAAFVATILRNRKKRMCLEAEEKMEARSFYETDMTDKSDEQDCAPDEKNESSDKLNKL